MTNFFGLREKTYIVTYIDDCSEYKKIENTKTCVINRKLKFENDENCLKATQIDNKIKQL